MNPCHCDLGLGSWCPGCRRISQLIAEGRRYLYRNVACEARKTGGLEKHMPDVKGWT